MSNRDHWKRMGVLVLLAALGQGWMVTRNPIPAQDSIVFIQFARQLDHHSLADTFRSNSQHPLYPVLVWLTHKLLSPILDSDGTAWVRSAQCVAAAATALLVLPMYLAGLRLSSPALALAAPALFSVLPFTTRLGADGLSDSTYLLFTITAFWTSCEFLATGRAGWLIASGLGAGFGFLARPEAMILPAAFGVVIIVVQSKREWRMPWNRVWLGALYGLAGLLLVVAPYALTVGKLTPKGSLNFLPGGDSLFAKFDAAEGRPKTRTFSDGRSVIGPSERIALPPALSGKLDFALKHRPADKRVVGRFAAIQELLRELVEGLHYVFGPLALAGLFFAERKPANVLCSIVALILLALLVQFGSKSGYIASRHVLTLVCLGCYVVARGGWAIARALAKASVRRPIADSVAAMVGKRPWQKRQRFVAGAIMVAAGALCLPRSLSPLHRSRTAHVEAGHWLAEHAAAGSIVLDSRGWASLYSGLPAYHYDGARLAFEDPRLAFVVVEEVELSDEQPRGETLRHLLSAAGRKVVEFPSPERTGESVVVFAWHPERLVATNEKSRNMMMAN